MAGHQDVEGGTDPDFTSKMRRILDLCDHPPPDGRVLCVDEFGPLNLQPRPGRVWRPVAQPVRLRATYTRDQARLDELPARQRVELLELRRRTHPAEVREPYRALIDAQLLDSYDKRRYDKALTLLRSLREAYTATSETAQVDAYLQALRAEHKRRPTFLAKLDAARL